MAGDELDVYLAKIVDERLAMKAIPKETASVDGTQTENKGFEELLDTNAGEREGVLGLG